MMKERDPFEALTQNDVCFRSFCFQHSGIIQASLNDLDAGVSFGDLVRLLLIPVQGGDLVVRVRGREGVQHITADIARGAGPKTEYISAPCVAGKSMLSPLTGRSWSFLQHGGCFQTQMRYQSNPIFVEGEV